MELYINNKYCLLYNMLLKNLFMTLAMLKEAHQEKINIENLQRRDAKLRKDYNKSNKK
jgi:hypothetical protein